MYSHGRLLLRFALTTALVLWAAQAVQKPVITALLPVLDAVMLTSQQTFKVIDVQVVTTGNNQVVRLRANLAGPMQLDGYHLQPVEGWFEVSLTVGGVVSYAVEGKQYVAVMSGRPSGFWINDHPGSATAFILALP